MTAFDLAAPLPTGTTVLEASAGTGKTYTIAGLVTRYVAEGRARVDELLVVTFGRGATTELRTRVRERMLAVRLALGDPARARASSDTVCALLAQGSAIDVDERIDRLMTALAAFDTATVATVHEFCLQVLHGLGTAGPDDGASHLVTDVTELTDEVADDLYLRKWAQPGAPAPSVTHDQARAVAQAAVGDREARLLPDPVGREATDQGGTRAGFAQAVRVELGRRVDEQRVLGYDDLLRRVREAMTDPVTGPVACKRLSDRYRVVLVDEFQDTDPVQWEVLRRAFDGVRPLVLIGDPKQAIYGFRGADVGAYLSAREHAGQQAGLMTNHRSDPGVLAGLATLFRGAALGADGIRVGPVVAARSTSRLHPEPVAVRLRVVPRTGSKPTLVGVARPRVAGDVAAQVVRLLAAGTQLEAGPQRVGGGGTRPLGPRDLAVLVRTRVQAQLVEDALTAAGVESVVSVLDSVFRQPAAHLWLLLLEAVEQPHRSGVVRRLVLSAWIGGTGEQLDGLAGEQATDTLSEQLRAWGEALGAGGVAALFGQVTGERQVMARLLGQVGGDRLLTDLRHLAEVLHAERSLGLVGLLSWLRERIERAATDASDLERARRLDTEAPAVTVMTVHASKGLEWPVVLVPYGWDVSAFGTREQLPRGHDQDQGRTLFVGGKGDPGYDAACAAQSADDAGEELRLLYVAVTRAASQLLLWWQGGKNTERAPLHRLLLGADPRALPVTVPLPSDEDAIARFSALGFEVELVGDTAVPAAASVPGGRTTPSIVVPVAGGLELATLARSLDLQWRRTSYTALTREAHEHPGVSSEPDVEVTEDEPAAFMTLPEEPDAGAPPSPMAELPGGAAFGTLVHEVLEDADLTLPGLEAELIRAAAARLQHRDGGVTAAQLGAALVPAVQTPLGPLAHDLRLTDATEQLVEMDFELPLGGGDEPGAVAPRLGALADLLREHLREGDPVLPYAARVESLGDPELRGYLVGAIDLVLRAGDGYLVVDHKTNMLGARGVPLTTWHYRREAMDAAVLDAHYPLQALLYCVALHRYLRWRQPGYDPERHLGGVLYLFLRGMVGHGETGVWSWKPPAALVVALSDLLAGS